MPRTFVVCLTLSALAFSPVPCGAQLAVGDLLHKEALLRELPADSPWGTPREVVAASTGRMSVMERREADGGRRAGVIRYREVFLVYHARSDRRNKTVFDRVAAAVRVDSLFRVVYVGEMDPGLGFIDRFHIVAPPRDGFPVPLLHIRYAQTGTGAVTQDELYALGADERLVRVPIDLPDLEDRLADGEYLCCGSFTAFDDQVVELTTFITRGGPGGITHRVRSRFRLEGRHRYDEETGTFQPRFRLVAHERGEREPVGGREPLDQPASLGFFGGVPRAPHGSTSPKTSARWCSERLPAPCFVGFADHHP